MAILRLGPSSFRGFPAVDQTRSAPTPIPGRAVPRPLALARSDQRPVEPTHALNGLG